MYSWTMSAEGWIDGDGLMRMLVRWHAGRSRVARERGGEGEERIRTRPCSKQGARKGETCVLEASWRGGLRRGRVSVSPRPAPSYSDGETYGFKKYIDDKATKPTIRRCCADKLSWLYNRGLSV